MTGSGDYYDFASASRAFKMVTLTAPGETREKVPRPDLSEIPTVHALIIITQLLTEMEKERDFVRIFI